MSRPQKSVWIAHPGAAPSIYELAAAVAGLGFDTRFETGFYSTPDGLPARLARALPARIGDRLERELKRRRHDTLKPELVRQHPLLELPYVAAARRLPHRPDITTSVMAWRNRRFDAAVARAIEREKPAAVIGHDTSTLETIRAANRVGTASIMNQLIGHIASGDPILAQEAAQFPDWADSLHAGAPQWLMDQCLAEAREAAHVLAPSEYVRQTMIAAGTPASRIHLLPFGVRIDRFKPPAEADKPKDGKLRLLYVGQISQRKGLVYLLEALKQLANPMIELTLVGGMVGAGRGLAAYDGLYRHVRNVPHSEVARLFAEADLFVYPSLHEGSALAILEAMATGLPVITTLNSGSWVRDGIDGHIVPIRDVQALAERIGAFAADRDRLHPMGIAARARAEEFTWDHYRARLGEILDRVTGA